jgi:hypothetical protein
MFIDNQRMNKVWFNNDTIQYLSHIPLSNLERYLAFFTKTDFCNIESDAFRDILKSKMGKFIEDVDYCLQGIGKEQGRGIVLF